MLLRELTFYCQRQLTIPEAQQLRRLASMFKSKLLLINLTRRQQADPEQPFALLTVAARRGDLCQLVIEGLDAELAHMVLTSWVNEHGQLLSVRRTDFSQAQARLARVLPEYHFTSAMLAESNQLLDKPRCLQMLVDLLPGPQVLDSALLIHQLLAREAISSTAMRPGLAMPHVMSEAMHSPCLALLRSQTPLEWGSALGPVQTLVLLATPAKLPPEQLRPLTTMVRALLDDHLCGALLRASSQSARHAILIEILTQPAG